jgi:hypothetical protein
MMQKKNIFLSVLIFMTLCFLTGTTIAAATTELHIVKYANDNSTILNETTVDFAWMEANLPVYGDGVTHYYMQGPVFNDTITDKWNPEENDPAILTKDFGAVKGTNLRDLCDLVGGMSPTGFSVTLLAPDSFSKSFAYSSVYSPPARAGPVVLTWYRADEGYVNESYATGIRNVFFADTTTNPWAQHVFGLWDMHETVPEKFWHFYQPGQPSATGLSVQNINRVYIYSNEPVPLPTVTGIIPARGPVAGNTIVTITGTGFTGTTAVKFGTTKNITPLTVVSDTRITVKSPAHAAGTVNVRVTTPVGTSTVVAGDRFTYTPRPTVTSISPTKGPLSGNTLVTITGTGFTGATAVRFGGSAGTNRTVVSATQITVRSPAHAAGPVDIRVTTPGGTSTIAAGDKFTYVAAPTITNISPASGPRAGGTLVTITGTGFTGATAVKFGGSAGSSRTVVSATQITVRSPAHAAGTVDIRVTTPGGTSAVAAGDRFTYT